MGTIRMVMLDGLTVGDLLALRQGGFFEGAAVQLPLPSGAAVSPVPVIPMTVTLPGKLPDKITVEVDIPPSVAPPAPAAPLPPEQVALLAEFRAEAAAYRAEKGLPPAQDARSEGVTGIDPTPAAIVAPDAPASMSAAGLPSIDQLAACTKLRDVMQLLVEGGMAAGGLAAYLEGVRDQVPLLQRISNIPERVARTLSVMQQGG